MTALAFPTRVKSRHRRRQILPPVLLSLLPGQTACAQLAEVDSTYSPVYASMMVSFLNHPLAGSEGRQIRIQDAAAWRLYVKPASPAEAPQLNEEYFRPLGNRSG